MKKKSPKKSGGKTRTIKVDYLARVEGEGALFLKLKGDQVTDCQLKIFEPPRFFEAFLQGRKFHEAPDITARICGICPIAYQMSSVHAMEDALDLKISPEIRELRRLIYCGEWIESHTLHIYMLHAPDFLGYASAMEMAKDHPEVVRRGLQLKKVGNEILQILGGREIHPINVRVGGFYRAPTKKDLEPLKKQLEWAREAALETLRWAAGFSFPQVEMDYEFVALRHPGEYPFNEGRLVSNRGLDIAVADYEDNFQESHVPHTNALHSTLNSRGSYFVGPMARFHLNFDRLDPTVQKAARQAGLEATCKNPFQSILVRGAEVLHACVEALGILDSYQVPDRSFEEAEVRAATGYGCTEAPRGLLYQRYQLNADGTIAQARIVPPTSQNQKRIEEDLVELVPPWAHLEKKELQWKCEQAVRNYDPCISCATHFLKLEVERE